ncbi:hypothetical protein [Rhodoflexus sp.]|jgi:hypothetical protein
MTFVIIGLIVAFVIGLLSFVSQECVSSLMKDEEKKRNMHSHHERQIV